jgi:hypothetical protein
MAMPTYHKSFEEVGMAPITIESLSKLPENPRLLNLGMNGCPEGRPFLSARRQGTMACSGHGTEDKFAN